MKASYYEGNHTFSVSQKDITPPATDEVQIKVAYCGVCGTDVHIYHGVMDRRVQAASLLTFQGGITVPAYAASKGAIGQLTMAFANEWASKGVNVNAIAPGYISTDNTEALRLDPDRSKSILERILAGRWGEPEDFGGPVVFLSSDASSYMHGSIMLVDGGWIGR